MRLQKIFLDAFKRQTLIAIGPFGGLAGALAGLYLAITFNGNINVGMFCGAAIGLVIGGGAGFMVYRAIKRKG